MKNLFKRLDDLEATNKYSYEQLSKLYQPIFAKVLKQLNYKACHGKNDPSLELTKREEKISELYEQIVRSDPVLYATSIYASADRAFEKEKNKERV